MIQMIPRKRLTTFYLESKNGRAGAPLVVVLLKS